MARLFNGSTDFIDCGANVAPTSITLSCLVNPTSLTPAYSTTICRNNGGSSLWQLFIKSSGKLAFYVGTVNGIVSVDPGTLTVSTSVWSHIALTYDATTAIGICYVNGANSGSGSVTSPSALNTAFLSAILTFGQDAINAGRFFAGSAADMAIWSVALTPLEISALARGIRPSRIRSSRAIWLPIDGLVSPEPDLSGNGFNGTLTGTVKAFGPPFTMFTPRGSQFPPFDAAPAAVYTAVGQTIFRLRRPGWQW